MRVLQVDAGREMRGGQWQVLRLQKWLESAQQDSVLLCPRGSPLFFAASRAGLRVRPLTARALAREADQHTLVHAHDARAHTGAALVARGPLLVSRRVAFPLQPGLLSRWKYGRARRFLAVSQYVADVLRRSLGETTPVTVIYDGVELPSQAALGSLVITPASTDPGKGQALAEAAARRAGVALHVSPDLAADLPRSRLLLYLSREEGLGSAALLAMAHGVPVLASRVGGLPEIVRPGETGWLVDNNEEAVAAALRARVDDVNLARVGAQARTMVEQSFTVEHTGRRTLAVYKELWCS